MRDTGYTRRFWGRRGFSILELLVAASVLTVLLIVLAQVLATLAHQRRASARRLLAAEEAANAMERVAVMGYSEVTVERVKELQLSEPAVQSLTQGRLTIDVVPADGPPEGKRITVEVVWQDRAGQDVRPIRLTAWRYPVDLQKGSL